MKEHFTKEDTEIANKHMKRSVVIRAYKLKTQSDITMDKIKIVASPNITEEDSDIMNNLHISDKNVKQYTDTERLFGTVLYK